jgi:hypothetical protein
MFLFKGRNICLVLPLVCQMLAPVPHTWGQCQRAKLAADDGAPDDWFGYAVDVSGDVTVIGAPFDDDHGSNSGAVYIFERSASERSR